MGSHDSYHFLPSTFLCGFIIYCVMSVTETVLLRAVKTCPTTAHKWRERAANLSCSHGNIAVYHCMNIYPLENLVETCTVRQLINPSKRDGCPTFYLERGKMNVYFTSCPMNITGCPQLTDTYYYTDQLWKYPSCFVKETERTDMGNTNINVSIATPEIEEMTSERDRNTNINVSIATPKKEGMKSERDRSSQRSSEEGGGDNKLIIGLIIGGICLVMMVTGVICITKRCRNKNKENSQKTEVEDGVNDGLIET